MNVNALIVKKEINKKTDEILNEINRFSCIKDIRGAFVDDDNEDGKRDKKIGRTQLASLLSDVKNASTVDEIKLYISYKKAKAKKNSWATVCDNKTVAEHLIDSIKNMEQLAESLKPLIEKDQGEILTQEDMRVIKLMIVEKFLGYLYWKGTVMANKEG